MEVQPAEVMALIPSQQRKVADPGYPGLCLVRKSPWKEPQIKGKEGHPILLSDYPATHTQPSNGLWFPLSRTL